MKEDETALFISSSAVSLRSTAIITMSLENVGQRCLRGGVFSCIHLQLCGRPRRVRQVAHLWAVPPQAAVNTAALVTDEHTSVHWGPARLCQGRQRNTTKQSFNREKRRGRRGRIWLYCHSGTALFLLKIMSSKQLLGKTKLVWGVSGVRVYTSLRPKKGNGKSHNCLLQPRPAE